MKQIEQIISNLNNHFFIQFGGQGASWFSELKYYYHNKELFNKTSKLFKVIFEAIEEEKHNIKVALALPHGLNIQTWLEDESTIPFHEYLFFSGVSMSMIQFTQLVHLEYFHKTILSREELLNRTELLTGHSQGIIPAILLALNLKNEQYYQAVKNFIKLTLYISIHAQDAYPFIAPSQEEIIKSKKNKAKYPNPMAVILGSTEAKISKLIKEFNAGKNENEKIFLSLKNFPGNLIISGYRSSLINFHTSIQELEKKKELKLIYLKSTGPCHSKLLERMSKPFEEQLKQMNFPYSGKDLKKPVIAFTDGANIQQDKNNLGIRLYRDTMINSMDWRLPMQQIKDIHQITHGIDFGPGNISQKISQNALKILNSNIPVLCGCKNLNE